MATIAALCAGCIAIPFPVPDRPPDVAPFLPAEFASGDVETLVLVVTLSDPKTVLDEALFVKPEEIGAIPLLRIGVGVVGIACYGWCGGFGGISEKRVQELCLITADGRTVSLHRRDKNWVPSAVSAVDAAWRDQFVKYFAEIRPVTLIPTWKSSPCQQVDWTRSVTVKWTDEQRTRVIEFLRKLPTQ